MKKAYIVAALLSAVSLAACEQPTAADKEQQAQTAMTAESDSTVGYPAISNWTEKKFLKLIYELRDKPNYATYTYLVGMNNQYKLLCHSVGFGIPESVQYTAPESEQRVTLSGSGYTERLPQADPNGLYSSPSANGTWVMCVDPVGKTIVPVRSEPNIITSPIPLDQLGGAPSTTQ
jgi:hypothetical protein